VSHDGWVGLHVLGVVLFLGNLIVTAVWKVLADRTRQVDVIAYAQRLVAVTDIAFTAPGAILIAVSGGFSPAMWAGSQGLAGSPPGSSSSRSQA